MLKYLLKLIIICVFNLCACHSEISGVARGLGEQLRWRGLTIKKSWEIRVNPDGDVHTKTENTEKRRKYVGAWFLHLACQGVNPLLITPLTELC